MDGRRDRFEKGGGLTPGTRFKQYRLVYQNRPAHVVVHIVLGIGITRFEYGHHDTVSETPVRLADHHKGGE